MFPRCGIPDHFGSWDAYADYVDFLFRDQLDRRAHADLVERAAAPLLRHRRGADHGRAVVRGRVARRCWRSRPRASRRRRSTTTPAGASPADSAPPDRGEPVARDRYGLDGKLIDLDAGAEIPAAAAVERPAGVDRPMRAPRSASTPTWAIWSALLASGNGAQRQRRRARGGRADARRSTPRSSRRPRRPTPSRHGAGGAVRGGDEHEPREATTTSTSTSTARALSEEELRARLEEELRRITVPRRAAPDHRQPRQPRRASGSG